jgi:hypothetical protein
VQRRGMQRSTLVPTNRWKSAHERWIILKTARHPSKIINNNNQQYSIPTNIVQKVFSFLAFLLRTYTNKVADNMEQTSFRFVVGNPIVHLIIRQMSIFTIPDLSILNI